MKTLSRKVETEAIVWVIIASIQLFLGIIFLISGFSALDHYYTRDTAQVYFFEAVALIVVSIVNYIVSSKDFKYSKDVLVQPIGIVKKFTPIGGYIGTLIYNILFGGLIGIIGSIFGFVTRSYVMNNATIFNNIENEAMGRTQNV